MADDQKKKLESRLARRKTQIMNKSNEEEILFLRKISHDQTVSEVVSKIIDDVISYHTFSCVIHSDKIENFGSFAKSVNFLISAALKSGVLISVGYQIMDSFINNIFGHTSDSIIIQDGYSDAEVITPEMSILSKEVGFRDTFPLIAIKITESLSFRDTLQNYASQPFSSIIFSRKTGTTFKPQGAIIEICDGDAFLIVA